jgi:hypothetical protein
MSLGAKGLRILYMELSVLRYIVVTIESLVLNNSLESHSHNVAGFRLIMSANQLSAPLMCYLVGSKSFRPDIQKPRQMENAVRDIEFHLW